MDGNNIFERKNATMIESTNKYISDSCLNDPIIKQMLTGRDIDSSDQAEMERLNRMTMMLKSSKKI